MLIKLTVFFLEIFIFTILTKPYISLKEIYKIGLLNSILIIIYVVLHIFYVRSELQFLPNFPDNNYIESAILLLIIYRLLNLKFEINYNFKKSEKVFHYFHQKDKRWKNIAYKNSTIGNSGCGLAILAMLHSILNENINPEEVSKWINSNSNTGTGNGTPIITLMQYLNNIGLKNEYIPIDADLSSEIKSNTVICVLWQSYPSYISKLLPLPVFKSSHYVLLYDIRDGKAYIADPDNYTNTIKPMRLKNLLKKVNRHPQGVTYPYISVKF